MERRPAGRKIMKKLWKGRKTLRENLQRRLPQLTRDYYAAGRTALTPGTSWDDMHQFRLASKRFRYTLELFRPAYGPGLEAKIEAIKKIQTYLGDINDCIVTSAMLEKFPATEDIRGKLSAKADDLTTRLRVFWVKRFDAPGQEEMWVRYLTTYVCRRRPAIRKRKVEEAPAAATPESAETAAT
jgi:CHAD domain-containing protein